MCFWSDPQHYLQCVTLAVHTYKHQRDKVVCNHSPYTHRHMTQKKCWHYFENPLSQEHYVSVTFWIDAPYCIKLLQRTECKMQKLGHKNSPEWTKWNVCYSTLPEAEPQHPPFNVFPPLLKQNLRPCTQSMTHLDSYSSLFDCCPDQVQSMWDCQRPKPEHLFYVLLGPLWLHLLVLALQKLW